MDPTTFPEAVTPYPSPNLFTIGLFSAAAIVAFCWLTAEVLTKILAWLDNRKKRK
jgi:hypothetical protein